VKLSDEQRDAIAELINIAFSRTAASLADLTGRRIVIDVPKVDICPSSELTDKLKDFVEGDLTTVHQVFSGPVSGTAMLMLNTQGASMLVDLLTDGHSIGAQRLDTTSREVLTEVGNILLNACLGMFGNLLKIQVSFSVPDLHLEHLDSMMRTITIGEKGLEYALLLFTTFRLKDSAIEGCLVIVLSVASLERFLEGVKAWAAGAGEE